MSSQPYNPCAGADALGYVDPNWPRPNNAGSACIIIYGYVPSIILCALALALFFIALVLHSWLLFKYKTWYFIPVTVGLVMELVGYVARTFSSQKNPYGVIYFVIQYFFIVVAPVMFSAAIYTLVSIAINRVGRQFAPIAPKLILWIFIVCDVVATVVQVAGAAMIGAAESDGGDPTTPNNILLAGLAFQVFAFFLFIVVFIAFVWRSRKVTTSGFKTFAAAAFVATLAVYLRTVFRLAETAEGLLKGLSTHEVYFGCLEFLPIVVAVYTFAWWHPGRWLGNKHVGGKAFADEQGGQALSGEQGRIGPQKA